MKSLPDKRKIKHGMSRTRIYRIYQGMKQRCTSPRCATYRKYGAKGISVCDEWMGEFGFQSFYEWSVKNGYTDELTIDRIDPNGDYSPQNCRWATYTQQNTHLSMLKNNKSGVVGVSWSKKERRWIAMISINNRPKRIGSFKAKEEAAEARNRFIRENALPHQLSVVSKDEVVANGN